MKSTPLEFDNEGHSDHLEDGTYHSNETLIMEVFDNSGKAIEDKKENNEYTEDKIEYINTKYKQIFLDTGTGMTKLELKNALIQYKKNNSKDGINRSGIGLKQALNNLLKKGHFVIIVSKTNDGEGDIDYSIKSLVKKGSLEMLHGFEDLSSKRNIHDLIDQIIPKRGTLFILNKCELDEDEDEDDSKKAFGIFKECVDDTNKLLKCECIPEEIIEDTSYIETMVSDLCNYPYDVIINKRKVEHKQYIDNGDEKMFSLNIYLDDRDGKEKVNKQQKEQIHPHFYLKNEDGVFFPYKFLFTKKHGEVKLNNIDPEKDIPETLVEFCNVDYYKLKNEKDTRDSDIAYILNDIRKLFFCPLSLVRAGKDKLNVGCYIKVHNYLKVECTIKHSGLPWCKKHILKSQKTSDNYNSQIPEGKHKSLNFMLTTILFNKDILKYHDFKFINYNVTERKPQKDSNPRHFSMSEIKERFPEELIKNKHVEDTEPVVEDPEQVVEDPEQVVEDPEPVVEDPEPVVEDPEPIVDDPEPIVDDPEPIVDDPDPDPDPYPDPNPKVRANFSDSDVTLYKQEHRNECFLCGKEFVQKPCPIGFIHTYSQKDHWDGNRKNNSYENLRMLCLNCHEHKTRLQKSSELPDEIKDAEFRDYPLKVN